MILMRSRIYLSLLKYFLATAISVFGLTTSPKILNIPFRLSSMFRIFGSFQLQIQKSRYANKYFNKLYLFLTLFLLSCSSKAPVENLEAAPKIGAHAPSFNLESIDRKKVSFSEFKGRVLLLDFWATWCPPCRLSTPALVTLNKKFKGKDFSLIGISLDEDSSPVLPFIKKEKVEHIVLYSGESHIEKDYQIRAIPTFFLIDKKGIIRKRYDGFYPEMAQEWEKEINLLLLQ